MGVRGSLDFKSEKNNYYVSANGSASWVGDLTRVRAAHFFPAGEDQSLLATCLSWGCETVNI